MKPLRILLTAGPTREPLDPVRYLGNRSSGKMGIAIIRAALEAGHSVTAVLGPVESAVPDHRYLTRVNVETAKEMHAAVLSAWPAHDLLVMAAAVADYRPVNVSPTKMSRVGGRISIELEPTEDIAAAACKARRPDQRVVGFSLEREGDVERARIKMRTKGLDLIVFNPLATMGSPDVAARLLYPDGREEAAPLEAKDAFAKLLLRRAAGLFDEASQSS